MGDRPTRTELLAYCSEVAGRPITRFGQLHPGEVGTILLKAVRDAQRPGQDEPAGA